MVFYHRSFAIHLVNMLLFTNPINPFNKHQNRIIMTVVIDRTYIIVMKLNRDTDVAVFEALLDAVRVVLLLPYLTYSDTFIKLVIIC